MELTSVSITYKLILYLAFIDFVPTDVENYKAIGFTSKSSIVNISSTLIIFLIIFISHMIVKYVFSYFSKLEDEKKWVRFFSKIRLKIIDLLFYFAYIRWAIESYENILMSATIEIYANEVDSAISIISYSFAWIVLISWIIFIWYLIYLCYKYRNKYIPKKKHFWMEVFSGVRNNKLARIYTSGVIIKSTFYILMVLVFSNFLPRGALFGLILAFQILYSSYIVSFLSVIFTK